MPNSESNISNDTYMEDDIFENYDEYMVINEKNDGSSIDVNMKKQINDIDFESMNISFDSSFYTIENLENIDFVKIYNIINNTQYLIFIDNEKMIEKNNKSCFFKNKRELLKEEFPGCVFLPYEYIFKLKKEIEILNNNILEGEFKNFKIYNNNDICYSIFFDEGTIYKDTLYKKMEIINKLLFIPIDKYNIKETEYKLRGFCQIVEELGAKNIEITFKKNNKSVSKKSLDIELCDNIELIAGNLGLSSNYTNNNVMTEKEDLKYILTYPQYNTIILNEKTLRNKIKRKKLIISDSMYNSNLELQYLIRSRCRHFITNYSTTFTLDTNITIDKQLLSKFKLHKIDIGVNYISNKNKKNTLTIVTNINFTTGIEYTDNIMGSSVSLDKIGFMFLLNTIKKTENNTQYMKEIGIYKIMDFIELYIENVLKHQNIDNYHMVINIMTMIKKEFTITVYGDILCNYFDINSQWIHFNNYIDLLLNRTKSFDKLGYLILINSNIALEKKITNIVKFIQELCCNKNIEKQFWEMLKPQRKEYYIFLKDKLINTYNLINSYNWYSMTSLIKDIEDYTIDFTNLSNDEILKKLITNMMLGYKYIEFYDNIIPFIIRRAHNMNYEYKSDIYSITLLEESLNYESFITAKINNMVNLDTYIVKKINRINSIVDIMKDFAKIVNKENNIILQFIQYILSNEFSLKYPYFYKKINIMIVNNREYYLTELLKNNIEIITKKNTDLLISQQSDMDDMVDINDMDKSIIMEFFRKVLIYNDKIRINNLPISKYTFDIIYKNYRSGIMEIEFNRYIVPFIKKILDYIVINNILSNNIKSEELKNIILKDINNYTFNIKCTNFYETVLYIKDLLNDNNFELNKDLLTEFVYI